MRVLGFRLVCALALVAVIGLRPAPPAEAMFDWCDDDPPVQVLANGVPYVVRALVGVPREHAPNRGRTEVQILSAHQYPGTLVVTVLATATVKHGNHGVAGAQGSVPVRYKLQRAPGLETDWIYGVSGQGLVQTLVFPTR